MTKTLSFNDWKEQSNKLPVPLSTNKGRFHCEWNWNQPQHTLSYYLHEEDM